MLGRMAATAASETLRVFRAAVVLCDAWSAFPGTTRIEALSDGEITIVGDRHDWIGDPSDWHCDGQQTPPQQGDRIEWDRGSYTIVFECQPAEGEDVFSPHGVYGSRVRVHTKVVEQRSNE